MLSMTLWRAKPYIVICDAAHEHAQWRMTPGISHRFNDHYLPCGDALSGYEAFAAFSAISVDSSSESDEAKPGLEDDYITNVFTSSIAPWP